MDLTSLLSADPVDLQKVEAKIRETLKLAPEVIAACGVANARPDCVPYAPYGNAPAAIGPDTGIPSGGTSGLRIKYHRHSASTTAQASRYTWNTLNSPQ